MPSGELGSVLQHIRRAIGLPLAADSPDSDLLERFVHRGEEAAFEAILRRHGPLVLGACRRMLSDPHDVEDAFQATFFIFVRKARGIARGEAVGSWLYRVAYHAAARVRSTTTRRRTQETTLDETKVAAPAAAEDLHDLQPLLDDAVNRLPEKYRRPVVLCCLEGKSNEQAARELGCAVGTVGTRLSRARERLRAMLTRRGVAVPAVALAAVLEPGAATASVPPLLLSSTLKAGMLLAAGETAASGAFSPAVAALAQGVGRSLIIGRLRSLALALTLMIVLTGSSWLTYRALAGTSGQPPLEQPPAVLTTDEVARFTKAHQLLKPQPGESRWLEAAWLTSVWEARRQAAAEGKPILLVVAGKDSPLGPCSWNGRLFRTPAAWTEDRLRLVQENFVPVAAVGDLLMKRQDAEGTFIRDVCQLKFNTRAGYVVCLTAGGKHLGSDPVKAWQAFQQLPDADRAPGAAAVGDLGEVDRDCEWPQPPPGGLILKIHARPLGRDSDGELRHARGDEFVTENPHAPDNQIKLQASPDFMWLKRDEWRQLVPADPRPGDEHPVPAALARRLFCYHLVPARIYNATGQWGATQVRAGALRLRVDEVTGDLLRLRLDGFAHLGTAYDPATPLEQHELGYEAQLLGFLTFDRRQQAFTRFDLTALGDVYGRMPVGSANSLHGSVRPGRAPLGFAFELIAGDKPADRIPPTGRYLKDYFGAEK